MIRVNLEQFGYLKELLHEYHHKLEEIVGRHEQTMQDLVRKMVSSAKAQPISPSPSQSGATDYTSRSAPNGTERQI